MAIDHTILRMFLKMQERYRLSGDIVTIGVQDVMFNHESGAEFFRDQNYKFVLIPAEHRTYRKSKAQIVYEGIFNVKNPMHMHDLFRMMGFGNVASLDAFDADHPTILHDMNKPIPEQHKGKYDVVFDVGSMEHVFDIRRFIQNCVELTKEGGVVILYDALSGWHNECFYNFQPPFFFDVFRANGFDEISLFLNYFPKYHDFGSRRTTWQRFGIWRSAHVQEAQLCHQRVLYRAQDQDPSGVRGADAGLNHNMEYYNDFVKAQTSGGETKPELSHYMLENMPGVGPRPVPSFGAGVSRAAEHGCAARSSTP